MPRKMREKNVLNYQQKSLKLPDQLTLTSFGKITPLPEQFIEGKMLDRDQFIFRL